MAHKASLTPQGTSQERFATSCFAIDEDILRSVYEAAVHQLQEHIFGQVSLLGTVDILQHRVVAQFACFEIHLRLPLATILTFRLG